MAQGLREPGPADVVDFVVVAAAAAAAAAAPAVVAWEVG